MKCSVRVQYLIRLEINKQLEVNIKQRAVNHKGFVPEKEVKMAAKENFNFDYFMNQMDRAVLSAQKTAVIAEKKDDSRLVKAARDALLNLRKAREIIDEPLVWFRMEKGVTYQRVSKKCWKPVKSGEDEQKTEL